MERIRGGWGLAELVLETWARRFSHACFACLPTHYLLGMHLLRMHSNATSKHEETMVGRVQMRMSAQNLLLETKVAGVPVPGLNPLRRYSRSEIRERTRDGLAYDFLSLHSYNYM